MDKRFVVLLIVLFLVGCGSSGPGKNSQALENSVHVGTQGLSIEFLDNALPEQLYEDEILQVPIIIQNKGAHDINRGELIVSLEDTFDAGRGDTKESFKLDGRSVSNPVGEETIVSFEIRTLPLFSQTELVRSTVRVFAEYEYSTVASVPICIDTDPYDILDRKGIQDACDAQEVSLSGGQGGPVAIVRVVPFMKQGDGSRIVPSFDIYIDNVGGGELLGLGDELDTVDVIATLSEDKLECNKEIVDIEKFERIRCVSPNGVSQQTASYSTLLNIELLYRYRNSISQEVVIKDSEVPLN